MNPDAFCDQIRHAFVEGTRGRSGRILPTEEEIINAREELSVMSGAEVRYWLPFIMIGLVRKHEGECDVKNLGWVFGILDVATDDDYAWQEKAFGHRAADYAQQQDRAIAARLEDKFKDFSAAEACVVRDWLIEAKSWACAQTWVREIEAATRYWSRRCERAVG